MIQAKLEAINRKTRILADVAAGQRYRDIAKREGVGVRYISQVAREAGIRKLPPRKFHHDRSQQR